MWSSGALSTALSSLMANQLALSVASNNIANVGDPANDLGLFEVTPREGT